MIRPLTLTLLAISLTALSADAKQNRGTANKRKQAVLSAKDAGPDFQFQGEYVGHITKDGRKVKFGAQVIALGDGKFRGVGYFGGLPGDGWDGKKKVTGDGKRDGDTVILKSKGGTGEITEGKLTVMNENGTPVGTLTKVVRKSPTLGKKPPKGAVVLFSGKESVKNWKNGQVTDDGLLKQGTMSKQTFQDFKLHLEFKLSFMPYARGQGRSNSGVYMQGRYEVQVLDSFGLEGKHNECGGIYSVKDPDVNMCFPPLSWQTYDVDFTAAKFDKNGKKTANARMTVWHNGVLVHKDVEVPKATTAARLKEGPTPGPIYIQNHGNPLRFRNIWVVPADE